MRPDLNAEAQALNSLDQEKDNLLAKWDDYPGTFGFEVAQTIRKTGRMSDRQRRVLLKDPRPYDVDPPDPCEDDYLITGYDLCVGEWKP